MTASLTCSSCGEANSTEMAFCIFCGAPLKSAKPASHSTSVGNAPYADRSPALGPAPTPTNLGGLRSCTNCGQADALSGTFCVFCGAQMGATSVTAGPGGGSLGQAMTAISPELAASEQRRARARSMGLAMALTAGALGAVLGGAMAYWYNHDVAPKEPARELPSHGLVILTAEPYAGFKLVGGGRRFLAGKTGAQGDITIDDIKPGNYDVELRAADGRTERLKVAVKAGEPTVIGGQTELFAR